MGKIRVKAFGNEAEEKKQKEKLNRKKEAKLSAAKSASGGKAEKLTEEKAIEPETKAEETKIEPEVKEIKEDKPKKKEKFLKKQKAFHSTQYFALVKQVDASKTYSLSEALELLEKLQRKNLPNRQGGFDETVELHLNTVSTGIFGNVTLPHGTGKKTRVAIANDVLIAEIEKGIINFDILVAQPEIMAKLAKVAKVLGPRGLMPNPKNGTITQNPEEIVKKYEGGQISFKTEAKSPIMHLTVGKMSFGAKKLSENIESMLKAVKKSNIASITLKSTMSPGIKLKV
jgi:large subunit ribosomal protein L1